ncbi:hypothetical protein [Thermococcus sp.]|uniref:hypothetical protein n=1 Tax=Thermococcus sp. TaxID=35749 RepID=UPI002601C560|nr:hypothetical protein [Thermococcus sp.]
MLSLSKAQTAIEVLFITGIILLGAAVITPYYLGNNDRAFILMQVKGAASTACSYINTGVVEEGPEYAPLNSLIKALNYTSPGCIVKGVGEERASGLMNVRVVLEYRGPVDGGSLEKAVAAFIVGELKSKNGVISENGLLKYGRVSFNVTVEAVRG